MRIDLTKLTDEQRRFMRSEAERYFDREFNSLLTELITAAYGDSWIAENIAVTDNMKASYWRENYDEGKKAAELYCLSREQAEPKALITEAEILENLTENHAEEIDEAWSEAEHYPMWGTLFESKNSGDYFSERAEELYGLGIGVIAAGDFTNEMLFIAGAGYDFYEAHWIPLFTQFFEWIKVPNAEKRSSAKELTLDEIDEACAYFLRYSERYQLNKDDEATFDAMIKDLKPRQMREILFQIGANVDLEAMRPTLAPRVAPIEEDK